MLATSFFDYHLEGGIQYMGPLTLLLLVNVSIFLYLLIAVIKKKSFHQNWLEAIKQIGGLALGYGAIGALSGLVQIFSMLEVQTLKELVSMQVIMGGLKVILISVLWGLIIFCTSLLTYIILKLTTQNSTV